MKYARRLQRIGSSILVSLPKEWVRQNKLEKGGMILLEIGKDNAIILYPSTSEESEVREIAIQYPSKYANAIVNEITGAYLLGYDLINIKGNDAVSYEDREMVKDAIRKLVGLEIVDEDTYHIKAQFLLDASTLDPEKILYRMNSIVSGMYRDTMASMEKKDAAILKTIARRDDEVDRQYFLLVRLIRSAMIDQSLASKLNLSSIDILDYRIAANLFEGAGDAIVELAKAIADMDISTDLKDIASIIEKIQDLAVNAFTKNNRTYSLQVIREYSRLSRTLDMAKQNADVNTLNVIYLLDKISRFWVDVADLVKPVERL